MTRAGRVCSRSQALRRSSSARCLASRHLRRTRSVASSGAEPSLRRPCPSGSRRQARSSAAAPLASATPAATAACWDTENLGRRRGRYAIPPGK
eukprot:CAMPEP_0185523906 /NCGR_PEP_ID=MMETSP1366-20130426/86667_1 /TAXON_ID=38817 /ORGANISM="Gephyrocapsa oceanica, Strain RCC1303" /LENGTH=93 /DNA_ID=CAMNT_0028135231 /DNA_START=94 /DNA_END=372 /DNA_ORIENTATION=-